MIKIYSLGSSSDGNCFLIYDGVSYLALDAGIKKGFDNALWNLNISKNDIDGCLITHGHKDHIQGINKFFGVPIYSTKESIDLWTTNHRIRQYKRINYFSSNSEFKIGKWTIKAVKNDYHDIEGAVYFAIKNASDETLTYITDTGKVIGNLPNAKAYIIECNHFRHEIEDEIKKEDNPNKLLVLRRCLDTHLSAESCAEYLKKNVGNNTEQIVLMHLGAKRNSPERMKRYIKRKLPKNIKVSYIDPINHDYTKTLSCGMEVRKISI